MGERDGARARDSACMLSGCVGVTERKREANNNNQSAWGKYQQISQSDETRGDDEDQYNWDSRGEREK